MSLTRRPYAYTRMEVEDEEERRHRKAQFLIYKVMERADSRGRRTPLRVRICRLKVKIGRRLKKLRKSMVFNLSLVRFNAYKQVMGQLKELMKSLLCNRNRESMVSLPPLLA